MAQHDLFFRKMLQNVDRFRAFCSFHLPEDLKKKIDFEHLKLEKLSASFIRRYLIFHYGEKALQDKKIYQSLKEEICDILYSGQLISGEKILLIFHVEHQSTPDPKYPLRNALYDISAMKDYVDNHPSEKPPIPISILFYHGEQKPYPHTLDLLEMFADKPLAQQYFLKPILVDLSEKSDEELLSHGELGGFELACKHSHSKQVSDETLENLIEAFENVSCIEVRKICYDYAIGALDLDFDRLSNAIQAKTPNRGEQIMTCAEQLIQRGIEEGMQEGASERARDVALTMLSDGQPLELITKYSKLSESEVIELKKSVNN